VENEVTGMEVIQAIIKAMSTSRQKILVWIMSYSPPKKHWNQRRSRQNRHG
jgi:hypothetical protein